MVKTALNIEDAVKVRKEAVGMTYDDIFMLGLETAEKQKGIAVPTTTEKSA